MDLGPHRRRRGDKGRKLRIAKKALRRDDRALRLEGVGRDIGETLGAGESPTGAGRLIENRRGGGVAKLRLLRAKSDWEDGQQKKSRPSARGPWGGECAG